MSVPPPAATGDAPRSPARVERLAVVIAFLVATVSIISAVIAGRAAVWSSTASDIDSLVLQEAIEREQIESDLELDAAADLRLAARYDVEQQQATLLRSRAAALRAGNPSAAARADLEAQAAWDVDLALWPYFRTAFPTYDAADALVFDPRAALVASAAANARLSELRSSVTPARASEARAHTLTLVGVAVLFVAALFALTLAEVGSGRSRWVPLLLALALAAGATTVTMAVEPETALLIGAIVAVAGVALGLALAALGRRERREARAATGAPVRPPEPEGGSVRFRGAVAVTLAAATLLGAGVGYLQGRAGDAGAAATRDAQDQALLALAEHQRAMSWASVQVETWSTVVAARARAAGARQVARYLASVGDGTGAAAAAAEGQRHDAVADAADRLTVLSDDHPDGPRLDPDFPSRFLLAQQGPRAARVARQDLANEANAAWGGQVAAYVAVLATIAIAAYLLGLSLVLRTRRLRGLFALTGLVLVLAAGAATALTALAPSTLPTEVERTRVADAVTRATLMDLSATTPSEHARAVAAWAEVIALHPTLARAHVRLASELFAAGSPQTTGYTSIATREATEAALAALERASALGWEDLGTRGDSGFYRFLAGLRDPASDATVQAIEDARSALALSPELPVLRFNLAVALLAAGRFDESRAAYDAAIAAVRAEDEDGRPRFGEGEIIGVSSGALTDLELVAGFRADRPDVLAFIADTRAAIVAGMGDPPADGAGASAATVSDLALRASPSELWWEARIDGFDRDRDALSVVWYREDPAVAGWQVLPSHSGPLRLDETTPAGGFYPDGAPPDYFASQGYLLTSSPSSCVPDGRYRVELYLDGRLAAGPVIEALDMPELVTERRTDLGLLFCRPATWVEVSSEAGRSLAFTDAAGVPVLSVSRAYRPDPEGDAGAAEVRTVIDSIAREWDPAAQALGETPVDTYLMGLADAQVQWYDGAAGRLKVFAGTSSFGTVVAVALMGTPDWVDGEEAGDVIGSFYLQ